MRFGRFRGLCIVLYIQCMGLCSEKRVLSPFIVLLLSLAFIIWIKVATDIFFIYALFYCLDWKEADAEVLKESFAANYNSQFER